MNDYQPTFYLDSIENYQIYVIQHSSDDAEDEHDDDLKQNIEPTKTDNDATSTSTSPKPKPQSKITKQMPTRPLPDKPLPASLRKTSDITHAQGQAQQDHVEETEEPPEPTQPALASPPKPDENEIKGEESPSQPEVQAPEQSKPAEPRSEETKPKIVKPSPEQPPAEPTKPEQATTTKPERTTASTKVAAGSAPADDDRKDDTPSSPKRIEPTQSKIPVIKEDAATETELKSVEIPPPEPPVESIYCV